MKAALRITPRRAWFTGGPPTTFPRCGATQKKTLFEQKKTVIGGNKDGLLVKFRLHLRLFLLNIFCVDYQKRTSAIMFGAKKYIFSESDFACCELPHLSKRRDSCRRLWKKKYFVNLLFGNNPGIVWGIVHVSFFWTSYESGSGLKRKLVCSNLRQFTAGVGEFVDTLLQ